MNILITGIYGFIGGNIVSALKEQQNIYGLDIVSPQKDGVIKTFGCQELEQIPSVDVVIHLAGKAHYKEGATFRQAHRPRGREGGDKNKSFSMRPRKVLLMDLLSS